MISENKIGLIIRLGLLWNIKYGHTTTVNPRIKGDKQEKTKRGENCNRVEAVALCLVYSSQPV